MGFGLLLAGYIAAFLMSMTLYGWAIRILGCIVMIVGCRKLHEYFRGFAYVEGAAALVALTGIAEGVFYVTERINSAVPDIVKTVEGWTWFAVVLLFHLLLGWELNLAAKAVGIEKPRTTALTSMVTAVICARYNEAHRARFLLCASFGAHSAFRGRDIRVLQEYLSCGTGECAPAEKDGDRFHRSFLRKGRREGSACS